MIVDSNAFLYIYIFTLVAVIFAKTAEANGEFTFIFLTTIYFVIIFLAFSAYIDL